MTKPDSSRSFALGYDAKAVARVLGEARVLLSRSKNDFAWSSWKGTEDALREIDELKRRIEAGSLVSRLDLTVLFAPTGPIQEVACSSGWGDEFLALAEGFDKAIGQK